ncbi:hypothetical protein COV04_01860 [Candidatus Uhrbacteria bacterium CG10_big_fil_rev_8_21_14_0_10_48_11]|uniref:Purine nucleoside phosphorylase n=1 Tax=Candidatus Uhrbacteria bacterium CG10_big_fil_rev_8_21_14_0_10_48_11 TaxID=1975037 RepID=A0A2M8LEV1_9BACT|nr:MAG: hypothetical protein COV04_01860 [Candidatus Uhrbacteria bacterium CG10_big_fil_rev_8_21_14_0_10_48_11]
MPLFELKSFFPQPYFLFESLRKDGSMKLTEPLKECLALANKQNFLQTLGIPAASVISALQVHGDTIREVSKKEGGTVLSNTDGFMTNEPGLFLTLTGADCLPLFFAAPDVAAVGILHAGWRGLAKGIIGKMVDGLAATYHAYPAEILVAVGPHICAMHYRFPDAATKFADAASAVSVYSDGAHLGLGAIAQQQLMNAGVLPSHLYLSQECTFELADTYFSYRRDKPSVTEATLFGIGMTKR